MEGGTGWQMVVEGHSTGSGEHTVQCTDDVWWNCVPETSVTSINLTKRKKGIENRKILKL